MAHLGDCAALLLRRGAIVRRTLNHTWRRDHQDATGKDPGVGPFDSIIVRAVGMTGEPEIRSWDLSPADMVALTAGVHDLLSDAELEALYCAEPTELARRLVEAAGSREPTDDIAALVFSADNQ